MGGAPDPSPLPAVAAPPDPTMQGRPRVRKPLGDTLGVTADATDTQGGPAAGGATGAPKSTPFPVTVTPANVTPQAQDQYIDPTLVERLRTKARTGYGGTFLTGPRGTLGGGG